ncbi:response regulator with CheY-like receiver domain and winged-helix DNA-binding domain [Owenweeksia hongkongensis DSM 17368]|uniref:Response regulator with CheY-like receiver domain and winged-helix DNA-binding domain n=1 Tax=Owenweeksia hongkongensis (strain DSM 17368 / CIP 108786 / JCM 12287 / NRRL B-23963 / UST20020801) TaxID=926562 RepID=G8R2C8_OWEHD|nr:response regulator transcription factor [Owenweeksia hongkongensis]AEV32918.1 response regulator with CheY-like receiver domain and winged-helix DNA-binding domain [Owenweeksia hongkongensis DSM 17368]
MTDKVKILIVDDEPLIRDALAFKLTKEGYMVDTAEDGEKAIEKIDEIQYDIIISDVMMPFISGFELLKILKERGSHAPVLLLTSLNSENAVLKAFELGADDYMTKPFSPKELSTRIKKLLKKNEPE